MSRAALVTPSAILKVLVAMAKSPHADVFFNSLPIAGVDGTLADRFVGTREAGQIHAKTGTIEHVNTLSGYMVLPSGKRLAFSILADNQSLQGDDAEKVLDALAQTIYDAYGGRARRGKQVRH